MSETVVLVSRLATAIVESNGDMVLEPIAEDTLLANDLGFGSIDFVRLVVDVERELGRKLGFHDLLMPGGKYVSDLSVGTFSEFIDDRMKGEETKEVPPSSSTTSSDDDAPFTGDDHERNRVTSEHLRDLRARIARPVHLEALPVRTKRLKRTLFVLTPPRSGSTLLQLMLSAHPDVFAPPELYMLGYSSLQQRKQLLDTPSSRVLLTGAVQAVMEAAGQSRDQAEAFLHQMEEEQRSTSDFYEAIHEWIGERLLVDKSPLYTSHVDILRRAERDFDEPLYIHLIRHPGGMIKSFLDTRIGEMIPFAQGMTCPPDVFAEMIWQISHENSLTFLEDIPETRVCKLQFEDLVKEPQTCLQHLCEFLQVPYLDAMANPYGGADGFSAAREVGRFSGDLKVHLYQGVQADAADRWRQHIRESSLSESTLSLYEQLIGVGVSSQAV